VEKVGDWVSGAGLWTTSRETTA